MFIKKTFSCRFQIRVASAPPVGERCAVWQPANYSRALFAGNLSTEETLMYRGGEEITLGRV